MPLWGALLIAIVIMVSLVALGKPVHAQELYHFESRDYHHALEISIGDTLDPDLNTFRTSNRNTDVMHNLLKTLNLTDAWERGKETANVAVELATHRVQQAIETTNSTVSNLRQTVDRPITLAIEKILMNHQVKKFIGIQSQEQIIEEDGPVNIYLVDDSGYLAGIMDRILKLAGYPKAAGGTFYPVGVFIKTTSVTPDQFSRVVFHEYCHYYQQSVLSFPFWLVLYSGEIGVKGLFSWNLSLGYKTCSWEEAADAWAIAKARLTKQPPITIQAYG
jgi:hypothetical protein